MAYQNVSEIPEALGLGEVVVEGVLEDVGCDLYGRAELLEGQVTVLADSRKDELREEGLQRAVQPTDARLEDEADVLFSVLSSVLSDPQVQILSGSTGTSVRSLSPKKAEDSCRVIQFSYTYTIELARV